MAKRPGLSVYLASQKLRGRARAEARLRQGLAEGSEDSARAAERLGKPRRERPAGPLVWLHAGNEAEALGFPELVDRLIEERDDLNFLITTTGHDPEHPLEARLPKDVIMHYAPYGEGQAVEAFLTHWKPDLCLWAENRFEPELIDRVKKAGIPMILVDARVPDRSGWRWLPGIRRTLLRQFDRVLAGDETARDGLVSLGVPADRVEAIGFLQEGTAPLPCSQAERDMLAEDLAGRPVWLAAGADRAEFDLLAHVHQQIMRRSHRLLMVLAPRVPEDGPDLARRLEDEGWVVGLRSLEDEPEPETEIYIADLPDEMGLWYRLAPIAFMGGTLCGGPVRNPYEAAALGSALLFGPATGPWRESFERLLEAGAARSVTNGATLARGVDHLLAPDQAARMAAAAWDITTNGAHATDRVVEIALDALDARGV